MKTRLYVHNGGDEVIPKTVQSSLKDALSGIVYTFTPNCASHLRRTILNTLSEIGWTDRIAINGESKLTITAMRRDIGLCLQSGNMARFYADLLKMQLLHQNGTIRSGIYLIPTQVTSKIMGSNLAHYERFTKELGYYRNIITIPMLVIGLGGE